MGAWLRRFENRIERELAAQKMKGVPEAPLGTARDTPADAQPPQDASDLRALAPPLGLREYWYPALPARKVGNKPLFWVMLGDELVLFRDTQGEVVALSDVCPHRGASLGEGDCFYPGFVTCPYHGACFDGRGECVAFLTEGPDSRMPGKLRVRRYPTRTLRDWVFVWMGEGEPAPIEEDVPPEFFQAEALIHSSYTYWHTNWLLAIENHSDAHNCFFVHRDSIKVLTGLTKGRTRTPLGPRSKSVNGRGLLALHVHEDYYAKDGNVPYQMYYPGVDGVWPLHRWRLLWRWLFKPFVRRGPRPPIPEEWGIGHHLPCIARTGGLNTRYAVAVKPNLSRIVYFYFTYPKSGLRRAFDRVMFGSVQNPLEYNFSSQDNGAASPCRYWTPEYLAPTDAQVTQLRRMVVEGSRDALRRRAAGNGHGLQQEPLPVEQPVRVGLSPESPLRQ